ncbi:hypothetical protein MJO29_001219, partial [Puccinia striiformis f. sp. tritici]
NSELLQRQSILAYCKVNYNYLFDQFFLCLIRFIHFVRIRKKCGGEGHISKDCSNPTTPKSCYNCGDSGHILIVLPQEEPNRPNNCNQEDKAKEDSARETAIAVNQDTSVRIARSQWFSSICACPSADHSE